MGTAVAGGRISGGQSEMWFDRSHFVKEGLARHLTRADFDRIEGHLTHRGDRVGKEEMKNYGLHIQQCNECSAKILSMPTVVLDQESLHTSTPPDLTGHVVPSIEVMHEDDFDPAEEFDPAQLVVH